MGIETVLGNEPWYLSLWLLVAQLLLIAWAFRPACVFYKFDLRGYWLGRHSRPMRWAAAIIGFFIVASAWLGFYFVLAAGYRSTLVFLSSSEAGGWLSPRDCLCALLSFAGATAVIMLIAAHDQRRRTRHRPEEQEQLIGE
jgi:hypothetical protein